MKGKWTIIKVKNCEILEINIIILSCQMKYRELPVPLILILIQIIQIIEWQFKKSILQTESRVFEQISEQKRTSKKIRLNEEFQRRA